jgi:pyruvate ferredoxin oxidoreductase beta subunit
LKEQGRFAHLRDQDIELIQKHVDEMWENWEMPGVAPLKGFLNLSA